MTSTPITLEQTLALARQLSRQDQAQLIARLAAELAGTAAGTLPATPDDLRFVIPIITEGTWDATIPTSRAELYDHDERC